MRAVRVVTGAVTGAVTGVKTSVLTGVVVPVGCSACRVVRSNV